MGDKTGISWTDTTWSPMRGCDKISAGCKNCYAKTFLERFRGVKGHPFEQGFDPRFVPDQLAIPLKWKSPRRVFVNSISDLFHDTFTNEQIAAVFGVMAAAPQHTFQILTKRPARMREWFEWVEKRAEAGKALFPDDDRGWRIWQMLNVAARRAGAEKMPSHHGGAWPLPNVHLGVSVENQAAAAERIPELLRTPAAVRFLSCEPLLGPLDLRRYMWPTHWSWDARYETPEAAIAAGAFAARKRQALVSAFAAFVDQVIAGCESGPGARPCEVDWLRSLRDQCADAVTAFFLKQAQEVPVRSPVPIGEAKFVGAGPGSKRKPGGIIELPYLDGVKHDASPAVPR